MATVRIATFNVENLFARFKFTSGLDPEDAIRDGWTADHTKFKLNDEESKHVTGALLNEVSADIVCLQEVENTDTLKRFRTDYLGGFSAYPYAIVLDGNDPRRIDLALLSKLPVTHIRSWQHHKTANKITFSRDCLEVDVEMPDGTTLTVYNNHLKSMYGGRAQTKAKRVRQAEACRDIVQSRFGTYPGDEQVVICGDYNDYRDAASGIKSLTNWSEFQDVVRRLPNDQEWTHYWHKEKSYRQLDYLMLTDSLANRHPGQDPQIWRYGITTQAADYTGQRYVGVNSKVNASDHCPVSFDLQF